MNKFYVIAINVIMVALLLVLGLQKAEVEKQQEELNIMQLQLEELKTEQTMINKLLEMTEEYQQEILRLQNILNRFEIDTFEITNYAPLGSGAIEGMCFEGDPNITASGQQFIPYLSAAASSDIPFGTKLYVEGFGYYEVHDRGGMITEGKLDLGVQETDEAYGFGRQKRMVLIEK